MQLTSILLYQNLKEHFQIADYRLLSKNQPLARPFFLEADKGFKNNHIYLTDAILDLEVFRSIPEDAVPVSYTHLAMPAAQSVSLRSRGVPLIKIRFTRYPGIRMVL